MQWRNMLLHLLMGFITISCSNSMVGPSPHIAYTIEDIDLELKKIFSISATSLEENLKSIHQQFGKKSRLHDLASIDYTRAATAISQALQKELFSAKELETIRLSYFHYTKSEAYRMYQWKLSRMAYDHDEVLQKFEQLKKTPEFKKRDKLIKEIHKSEALDEIFKGLAFYSLKRRRPVYIDHILDFKYVVMHNFSQEELAMYAKFSRSSEVQKLYRLMRKVMKRGMKKLQPQLKAILQQ